MSRSQDIIPLKTVFVIGAGASAEVNLPVGRVLKDRIARALDIRFENGSRKNISGDSLILRALRITTEKADPLSRDINPYLHAGWNIRDAMPLNSSIDHFIDLRYDDKVIELCGKLAITRTILEAEKKSKLYTDPTHINGAMNFDKVSDTWFTSFIHLLTENCRLNDLPKRLSSIALVIFNYDRCVEYFLYHALQNIYPINGNEAASLLQSLKIYHPYGTVGTLPWLSTSNAIEFGATPEPEELLRLAGEIKTFTEGTDPSSSEIDDIRISMSTAHRIVFLGFAFHRMNIDLLLPISPPPESSYARYVFATAKGISTSDVQDIGGELTRRTSISLHDIKIRDVTCSELFHEYWRPLSR